MDKTEIPEQILNEEKDRPLHGKHLDECSKWSLKKERKKLERAMYGLEPASEEKLKILARIKIIDEIISIRDARWANRIKVGSTILLTGSSLYLTYKIADNGDHPINRSTGRLSDGLIGKLLGDLFRSKD